MVLEFLSRNDAQFHFLNAGQTEAPNIFSSTYDKRPTNLELQTMYNLNLPISRVVSQGRFSFCHGMTHAQQVKGILE